MRMAGPKWDAIIPALLEETCPGAVYLYRGSEAGLAEAASPDGLLPVFMEQAMATASVMGGIPGVAIEAGADGPAGKRAVINGAPACLLLPFLLDAVILARESPQTGRIREQRNAVSLEGIMPPVRPSLPLVRPFPADVDFQTPGNEPE